MNRTILFHGVPALNSLHLLSSFRIPCFPAFGLKLSSESRGKNFQPVRAPGTLYQPETGVIMLIPECMKGICRPALRCFVTSERLEWDEWTTIVGRVNNSSCSCERLQSVTCNPSSTAVKKGRFVGEVSCFLNPKPGRRGWLKAESILRRGTFSGKTDG